MHINEHLADKDYTFKVKTKRSKKNYPLKLLEISSLIREHIIENANNMKVDVHKPYVSLCVEVRNNTYI